MKNCIYKENSPMVHHGITYENELCTKNHCACCGEDQCTETEFENKQNSSIILP